MNSIDRPCSARARPPTQHLHQRQRRASVEIDLGAYDFYGQLVSARTQTFKLGIKPEHYAGFLRAQLKFPLPIDLPHGQLNLRAGIFDTVANKAGTLQIALTVPKK
jgi:hypothetical protein